MRFQNALENARLNTQILLIALLFSFFTNVLLIVGWHHAANAITVHIPPQIPTTGISIKANDIPKTTIYSFALYIWQGINYWPNNGSEDYKNSLNTFSPYLTPQFKAFLLRDYQERVNQGEVQERQRTLQNRESFEISNVEYIGRNTWLVHLHMRLSEHMNINGSEVKDTAINYTLRVMRYEVNATKNVWGLALDGFQNEPKRANIFS